mmetsp:Transcript_7808/g.28848  ORF Transcript_7808/g.28848 Transcript_7808/m.28848 type:complete len:839 (+) Transcript_7808:193-2709(+)
MGAERSGHHVAGYLDGPNQPQPTRAHLLPLRKHIVAKAERSEANAHPSAEDVKRRPCLQSSTTSSPSRHTPAQRLRPHAKSPSPTESATAPCVQKQHCSATDAVNCSEAEYVKRKGARVLCLPADVEVLADGKLARAHPTDNSLQSVADAELLQREDHRQHSLKLRRTEEKEDWDDTQKASFRCGMYMWPKVFRNVQEVVNDKTTADCVKYYYEQFKHNEQSGVYARWKDAFSSGMYGEYFFQDRPWTLFKEELAAAFTELGTARLCAFEELARDFDEQRFSVKDFSELAIALSQLGYVEGRSKNLACIQELASGSLSSSASNERKKSPRGKATSLASFTVTDNAFVDAFEKFLARWTQTGDSPEQPIELAPPMPCSLLVNEATAIADGWVHRQTPHSCQMIHEEALALSERDHPRLASKSFMRRFHEDLWPMLEGKGWYVAYSQTGCPLWCPPGYPMPGEKGARRRKTYFDTRVGVLEYVLLHCDRARNGHVQPACKAETDFQSKAHPQPQPLSQSAPAGADAREVNVTEKNGLGCDNTVAPALSDATNGKALSSSADIRPLGRVQPSQSHELGQDLVYDIDLSRVSTCQGSTRTSDEGMEFFRTVVWPRMKANGWRFEKGLRPKDRFWIPPGVDRSNPRMKSRRDYFDSMRRVIEFLKQNPWHLAKNVRSLTTATTTPTTTDTNDKPVKVSNNSTSQGASQVLPSGTPNHMKEAEAESWTERQKLKIKIAGIKRKRPSAQPPQTMAARQPARALDGGHNSGEAMARGRLALHLQQSLQTPAATRLKVEKTRGPAELRALLQTFCNEQLDESGKDEERNLLEQILPRLVVTLSKATT